jgi:hypothetical protein
VPRPKSEENFSVILSLALSKPCRSHRRGFSATKGSTAWTIADPVAAALVSWLGVSMYLTDQAGQQDAVPAALWRRSDALRPLDLCRLARAVVSG